MRVCVCGLFMRLWTYVYACMCMYVYVCEDSTRTGRRWGVQACGVERKCCRHVPMRYLDRLCYRPPPQKKMHIQSRCQCGRPC
jgi:hypothetical protein